MSEQSYHFLSSYNLLTSIYSRYLWSKLFVLWAGRQSAVRKASNFRAHGNIFFVHTEINFHAHKNFPPCGRRFYDEASERKRRAKSPV